MKFVRGTAQELINWQKRKGYKFPIIAIVDNLNPLEIADVMKDGGAVNIIQRPAMDKQLVETVSIYRNVLYCTIYYTFRCHFKQIRHSATDKSLKNKYVALHLQSRFIRQVEIGYQIALLYCDIVRSAVFLTAYTCESCERSTVEIATSHTPVEESPKPFKNTDNGVLAAFLRAAVFSGSFNHIGSRLVY